MQTIRQSLSLPMTALRAVLRGIGRVDGDRYPTSFFRFVGQALPELRPCRVVNGFRKTTIMHHAIDSEVFNGDQAVVVHQPTRQLMRKVMALKPDTLMQPSYALTRLGTLRRPFLCLVELAIGLGQFFLFLAKEAWAGYLLAVRQGSELASQSSSIPTASGLSGRLRLYVADDGSIPLAGGTAARRAGFRRPCKVSVLTNLDQADLAQAQPTRFKGKAGVLWVGQAVVAPLPLVARKAGFLIERR